MRQRKHVNKISAEWLKTAGYLDTSDQDKVNYIFVPPKKKTENKYLPTPDNSLEQKLRIRTLKMKIW